MLKDDMVKFNKLEKEYNFKKANLEGKFELCSKEKTNLVKGVTQAKNLTDQCKHTTTHISNIAHQMNTTVYFHKKIASHWEARYFTEKSLLDNCRSTSSKECSEKYFDMLHNYTNATQAHNSCLKVKSELLTNVTDLYANNMRLKVKENFYISQLSTLEETLASKEAKIVVCDNTVTKLNDIYNATVEENSNRYNEYLQMKSKMDNLENDLFETKKLLNSSLSQESALTKT